MLDISSKSGVQVARRLQVSNSPIPKYFSSTPSGPLQGAKSFLVNLYSFVYISLRGRGGGVGGGGGEEEWINLNPDFAKKDFAIQHEDRTRSA